MERLTKADQSRRIIAASGRDLCDELTILRSSDWRDVRDRVTYIRPALKRIERLARYLVQYGGYAERSSVVGLIESAR